MRNGTIGALMVAAIAVGCGGGEEPAETTESPDLPADTAGNGVAAGIVEVRLVDSIPWDNEMMAGTDRRVEVRHGGGVDTIPDVQVAERPVVSDGAVWGFDWREGSIERAFRWTPDGGVETIRPPEDFNDFVGFALAPDARYLAYVARAEEGFRPKVVTWPEKATAYEGPGMAGYPSDAQNSSVEWTAPDRVDIRIRTDEIGTPGGIWLRARGAPTGDMVIDTVIGEE